MKLKKTIMRSGLFYITMIIFNVFVSAIIFKRISWVVALPGFAKFACSFGIGLVLMYVELFIIYDKLLNRLKLKEGQVWKRTQERSYIYIETQQLLNKKLIAVRLWVRDGNGPLMFASDSIHIPWPPHMDIRQDKNHWSQTGWVALEGKEKAKFLLGRT